MRLRVLGSAAGGAVPQWNCACRNCRAARDGTTLVRARSEAGAAVSADGRHWVLLNASPDVRSQIEGFPPLHPRGVRDSPIVAVALTNGELDHTLGLLVLREGQPVAVYATEAVREGFTADNPLYRAAGRAHAWRTLRLGVEEPVRAASGRPTGLAIEARPVPGKVPRHLEGRRAACAGDAVALRVRDVRTGRVIAYCPGAARVDGAVYEALGGAACVLFDGTFWSSDELASAGVGRRPAEDMAHAPLGGPRGSLAALARLRAERRILVHLNNTNPVLDEDAPERREAAALGWEVAADGLEVSL